MSNISTFLQQILNAVYGKDVRQAIHDAIQTCYEDASAGITPTITVNTVTGGHSVSITVGDDTQTFTVLDGADGVGSLPDGTYTGQILHAGGTLTANYKHVKFFIPFINAVNRTIEITNPVISVRDRGSYLANSVSSGITYTYTSYATGILVVAEMSDGWGGVNNSAVAVEFSYDLTVG